MSAECVSVSSPVSALMRERLLSVVVAGTSSPRATRTERERVLTKQTLEGEKRSG